MSAANSPKKNTRLHQLLAVGKSVKSTALSHIESAYHTAQKTPALFHGQYRVYHPKDENGQTFPEERQLVQQTVAGLISQVRESSIRDFDLTLQRDRTNQIAKASVIIDGRTIVENAPIHFLLSVEQQLIKLKNLIGSFPTPSPTETWRRDSNTNMLLSNPKTSHKTAKEIAFETVAAATDKHPAQVKEITRDRVVGEWETTLISGGITSVDKEKIANRLEQLIQAFRAAREEANSTEAVEKEEVGQKLFDFIFKIE